MPKFIQSVDELYRYNSDLARISPSVPHLFAPNVTIFEAELHGGY